MTFAFIHIPKTAGRSFINNIKKHTGMNIAPCALMAEYYRIPIGNYDLYGGHTFYQTLKTMLPEDTKYMTLLRDPVNRTYSHWKFLMNVGSYKFYGIKNKMDFGEFIRHPVMANVVSNFQCRYLTQAAPHPSDTPQLNYQLSLEKVPLDFDPDAVIEVLDKFAFVGTQERFADSMKSAFMLMGYYPHNVGQRNINYYSQISHEDLNYLEKINRADRIIYEQYK